MSIRDWPMARKFFASTMAITLTALTFSAAFLLVIEKKKQRESILRHTRTVVGMVANNAAAALVYDDETVARQILLTASADPNLLVAALYDASGELYAWYPRLHPREDLPRAPQDAQAIFSLNHLDSFAPVLVNGRFVGTALIRTDLKAMYDRFDRYVMTVAVIAVAALGLVFLLSRGVERWITRPLGSLAKAAQTIARGGDYSIRVDKQSDDEVGALVDAFNRMVREIEVSHEKIRVHTTSLESEVAARTAELTEIIGELESFSYSISHDMRAPLRAMKTYADLLLTDLAPRLDADSAHHLVRIKHNAARLELLVRDILTYSRMNKDRLELRSIELTAFLPSLVEQFRPDPKAPVIHLHQPLPAVKGHEAYLSQIFTNLISNAVKFTAPNVQPIIDISAVEEDSRDVRLFVRDNGIGIDEAHFDRIFEIFGRVHGESNYEGTGIGLAIVKKAVQRLGGSIRVSSQSGQGACFEITLARGR